MIFGKNEKTHFDNVRFLGEQDGPPEREFKARIQSLLIESNEVQKAYLARVDYDFKGGFHVALCLKSKSELSEFLDDAIGQIFAQMFCTKEHLDVFVLNDCQELELANVCKPFYDIT